MGQHLQETLVAERAISPIWPKLDGLERLASIRTNAVRVLPFIAFGVDEWDREPLRVLAAVEAAYSGLMVVVRSCAASEDALTNEPPGFFESVLGVDAGERKALQTAIDFVCRSYMRRPTSARFPNKILVQVQLLHPLYSGVCRIGHDRNDYIEVEYDDELSRTDAVTAGLRAKRIYLSACLTKIPKPWRELHKAANAIRRFFTPPFFLEFAINSAEQAFIFQIRPDRRPIPKASARPPTNAEFRGAAAALRYGPLSVMADWNPVEMLGRNPNPLDASLYNELLMSGAWSLGRASIGWRAPKDPQLMVLVGGCPYIKLKISLHTLLPKGLPHKLADALVDDRMRLLAEDPRLHDKVEFRVMWSAFAFDEVATQNHLLRRGFVQSDINKLFSALKSVTRRTILRAPDMLRTDRKGLSMLRSARRRLAQFKDTSSPLAVAAAIERALEISKAYGTIPFSRQARIAFTFRYMINYLVESGSVSADIIRDWEIGLNTVAMQLSRDLARASAGQLSRSAFDRRYGHLRPRTYSLEALRYDERAGFATSVMTRHKGRRPSVPGIPRLEELLHALGVDLCQRDFWRLASDAFRAREYIKFEFTAVLSDVLLLVSRAAEWSSLSRSTLSQLPIDDLLNMMRNSDDWPTFHHRIMGQLSKRPLSVNWRLPDVIFGKTDLHVVRDIEARPTFIGSTPAEGPSRLITGDMPVDEPLTGAVAAIEAPDPGFDWVFAQPLAGLITAYGGEFSHMGVRCAEFGIPAALGCGSTLFAAASDSMSIRLDPGARELWADARKLYSA